MKTVTLNFRDAREERPKDDVSYLTALMREDKNGVMRMFILDVDGHRIYHRNGEYFYIPMSELESALFQEDTADEG